MYWEHDLFDRYVGEEGEFAPRWLNVTYDDILPVNMRFGGTSLTMAEIGSLLDTTMEETGLQGEQNPAECVQSESNKCVPTPGNSTGEGTIPAQPQYEPGHTVDQDANPETAALAHTNLAMDDTLHSVETILATTESVLDGNADFSNVEINNVSQQDPLLAALSIDNGDVGLSPAENLVGLSSKLQSADSFSAEQSALLLAVGVSSVDAIRKRKM